MCNNSTSTRFRFGLFSKLGGRKKHYHFSVLSVFSVYVLYIWRSGRSRSAELGVDPATQNGGWRKPKNRTQKNHTAYIASLTKKKKQIVHQGNVYFNFLFEDFHVKDSKPLVS